MSAFTGLIRDGKIGKWCKRGAVLIAIAGTVQILLTLYALWGEYHQIQPNGQGPFDPNSFILFGASQLFTGIVTTVFFSLMLYAVGVIIVANSVPAHSDITYEKLDEAEITPVEGEEEEIRIVN
jgi:hypothetical protein